MAKVINVYSLLPNLTKLFQNKGNVTLLLIEEKSLMELIFSFKGRFLKFRRYHNFANLFSKLLETTFYKEISKFQ